MPDYISYDNISGRIIDRLYSVDPKAIEGRSDILEIPRDVFNTLTKYHRVDNGKIRVMTQAEIDALIAEEEQTRTDAENARIMSMDTSMAGIKVSDFKMEKIDSAIDVITNLTDVKQFLKRLVRYVAKTNNR